MDKKIPMTGKGGKEPSVSVELVGLDEIFALAVETESVLGKYEGFAEHVLLSCVMPEIPRYSIHDEEVDGTMIPRAVEALDSVLVRYRKMTGWMRQNGIDPEAVVGKSDNDKNLS